MSVMLEQAVVDAAALKEAAVNNAETVILEKYASEIKETVDTILEAPEDVLDDFSDEDDLEGITLDVGDEDGTSEEDPLAKDLSMAAVDGEKLCPCPDKDEEVEIDFDELTQSMGDEEEGLDDLGGDLEEIEEGGAMVEIPSHLASELHMYHYGMGDPIYKVGSMAHAGKPVQAELLEDAIGNLESYIDKIEPEEQEGLMELIGTLQQILDTSGYGESEQDYRGSEMDEPMREVVEDLDDLSEEQLDDILESLEFDYKNVPNGWDLGATEAMAKEAAVVALAAGQDDRIKKETEELNDAFEKIAVLKEKLNRSHKHIKSLNIGYNKIKSIAESANDKLEKLSVKNARLFYQNRILKSDSLNEQQKVKLVEAISKVDSVEKAKIAYETLQTTLNESKTPLTRKTESINEAVNKNKHVMSLILKNKQQEKPADPWKQRQQQLAGIKK